MKKIPFCHYCNKPISKSDNYAIFLGTRHIFKYLMAHKLCLNNYLKTHPQIHDVNILNHKRNLTYFLVVLISFSIYAIYFISQKSLVFSLINMKFYLALFVFFLGLALVAIPRLYFKIKYDL